MKRQLQLNAKYQYQSDQMTIYLIFILAVVGINGEMVALKQWLAHSDLVISVNIYNDNSKFVSGSNDNTVKVWSMQDQTMLYTQTFANVITHISLHPVDNRIFILVYNGAIKVLDPNTYATLHSGTYPTATGNGFFLRFFSSNSKYIISGYDVASAPILHIYNSVTYAPIAGGPTTTFPASAQTSVSSVSRDGQLYAIISTETTAPIPLLLYNLGTNTLAKTFVDNWDLLKWVSFSPHADQLYLTSNDKTLKAYRINPVTSEYDVSYSFSTEAYGYPNCINLNVKNQLVFSANKEIIFLNTSKTYPELIFSRKDMADIFVLDLSLDGKYLVTGMRYGEITVWQVGSTTVKKDQDLFLLIILGSTIGGFILIIIIGLIVRRFCCKPSAEVEPDEGPEKGQNRKRVHNKTEDSIVGYDQMNNSLGIP